MNKILVVDDIAANRSLLRQMLVSLRECEVIEASGGEEAVALFERDAPDLVLLDFNMPGLDGCQTASRIKALTGGGYTPIIFVTALSEESSLAAALASGGDDFISKPFDVEVLDSRIRAHLRIRELNQQLQEQNAVLRRHNERLTWEQELIEHFFTSALQQSDMDREFIRYHMSPLSVFNGDLLLVERGPDGGLYLVMGDFTGHGLTAAMGTLPVATIFFRLARQGVSLGDMARELNDQLNRLLPVGIFLAATLVELNPRGDRLSVWQGGMPASCWLGDDGQLRGLIESRHMPLGILTAAEFDDRIEVFDVNPGDRLYLYSDGLSEACDADGRMFGTSRVRELLLAHGEDRFEQLLAAFRTFTQPREQADDITLVELICKALGPRQSLLPREIEPLPWYFRMALSATDIQNSDPIAYLSSVLGGIPGLARHRGILVTILSEMYSNAVDHSILELDGIAKIDETQFMAYYERRAEMLEKLTQASVNIELDYRLAREPYLVIRITDNGRGYRGHAVSGSESGLHGRGLAILHGLCETVEFSAEGRTLEVRYRLQDIFPV